MANDAYGFFEKVKEYENIVYPNEFASSRISTFGKTANQEILRFRDNVDQNAQMRCLRGSVAQFDQYEAM